MAPSKEAMDRCALIMILKLRVSSCGPAAPSPSPAEEVRTDDDDL